MKNAVEEKSLCLAEKDPFQTLSVEPMSPSTPSEALTGGSASLRARPLQGPPRHSRGAGSRTSPFLSPFQGQHLLSSCSSGAGVGADMPGRSPYTPINLPLSTLGCGHPYLPRITAREVAIEPRVRGHPALIFE